MRKPKNYINNRDFYEAIKKYHSQVKEYKEGVRSTPPVMSDYIGSCFIQISNRLASKGNFAGYSYRDEMVDDGIENCIVAINSFDCEKYDNPFAYFSQIIWFAFLRRIDKEKKQSYIKHMSLVNASMTDLAAGGKELSDIHVQIDDEKAASYVKRFEKKKKEPVTDDKNSKI